MGELARAKVHNHIDGIVDARVVVVLFERWNHFIFDDALGCGIGDIFLHAVAWADVRLATLAAFLGLHENDHAVVLAFLSNAPTVSDFRGILFDAVALQVIDKKDEDLGGSGVVVGHKFPLQGADLLRTQGAGIVIHQARWVGRTRQLGFHGCAQAE